MFYHLPMVTKGIVHDSGAESVSWFPKEDCLRGWSSIIFQQGRIDMPLGDFGDV
jgi:hypothetical protein